MGELELARRNAEASKESRVNIFVPLGPQGAMKPIALAAVVALCLLGFSSVAASAFETIQDLDREAVFSFAIMSDNKGDSPYSRSEFAHMVQWINNSGNAFVIGLGDHLKKGRRNDFLDFLHENQWWHRWFYPTVADGENEYYGSGQGDWGAGRGIFDEVDLGSRPEVSLRENGAEYYAKITINGYTVHIISLTYSDTPKDPSVAFREDSRRFMISTLNSINKTDRDIVVVCAHDRGNWIPVLSPERTRVLMEKADLVLSASSHYYTRIVPDGYEHTGALCLNTGSITHASRSCPNGYLEVHVLANPTRIVTQYHDASRDERILECGRFSYVKEIGGIITEDVSTYIPGFPRIWPVDAQASPQDVVQGGQLTVSVGVAGKEGTQPQPSEVFIDLPPMGGGAVPLFDDGTHGDQVPGDGRFARAIQIPADAGLGPHPLTVGVRDGGYAANATVNIMVLPGRDYPIYLDSLEEGWTIEKMGSAEVERCDVGALEGLYCQNITIGRGGAIRFRYLDGDGMPTRGFRSLTFHLKPISLDPEKVFVQVATEDASPTIPLSQLQVDLQGKEWVPVSLDLSALGIADTFLLYVRIYSVQDSKFYLDKMALASPVREGTVALLAALLIGVVIIRRGEKRHDP